MLQTASPKTYTTNPSVQSLALALFLQNIFPYEKCKNKGFAAALTFN